MGNTGSAPVAADRSHRGAEYLAKKRDHANGDGMHERGTGAKTPGPSSVAGSHLTLRPWMSAKSRRSTKNRVSAMHPSSRQLSSVPPPAQETQSLTSEKARQVQRHKTFGNLKASEKQAIAAATTSSRALNTSRQVDDDNTPLTSQNVTAEPSPIPQVRLRVETSSTPPDADEQSLSPVIENARELRESPQAAEANQFVDDRPLPVVRRAKAGSVGIDLSQGLDMLRRVNDRNVFYSRSTTGRAAQTHTEHAHAQKHPAGVPGFRTRMSRHLADPGGPRIVHSHVRASNLSPPASAHGGAGTVGGGSRRSGPGSHKGLEHSGVGMLGKGGALERSSRSIPRAGSISSVGSSQRSRMLSRNTSGRSLVPSVRGEPGALSTPNTAGRHTSLGKRPSSPGSVRLLKDLVEVPPPLEQTTLQTNCFTGDGGEVCMSVLLPWGGAVGEETALYLAPAVVLGKEDGGVFNPHPSRKTEPKPKNTSSFRLTENGPTRNTAPGRNGDALRSGAGGGGKAPERMLSSRATMMATQGKAASGKFAKSGSMGPARPVPRKGASVGVLLPPPPDVEPEDVGASGQSPMSPRSGGRFSMQEDRGLSLEALQESFGKDGKDRSLGGLVSALVNNIKQGQNHMRLSVQPEGEFEGESSAVGTMSPPLSPHVRFAEPTRGSERTTRPAGEESVEDNSAHGGGRGGPSVYPALQKVDESSVMRDAEGTTVVERPRGAAVRAQTDGRLKSHSHNEGARGTLEGPRAVSSGALLPAQAAAHARHRANAYEREYPEQGSRQSLLGGNVSKVVQENSISSYEDVAHFIREQSMSNAPAMRSNAEPGAAVTPRGSRVQAGPLASQGSISRLGSRLRQGKGEETKSLAVGAIGPPSHAQANARFFNHYAVVKTIGSGTHGDVKLCLDLVDQSLVAIKLVSKALQGKNSRGRSLMAGGGMRGSRHDKSAVLKREAGVLKTLDHPNVVQLYEIIDDESAQHVLCVMEYVEGGPVQMRTEEVEDGAEPERLSEATANDYFLQLIDALDYLHDRGVIHGDIKPANLLLGSDGLVRLCDFGSATVLPPGGSDRLTHTHGSPAFLAPEICRGEEYSGKAADLWAAGVTLFMMLFGRLPFGERGMTMFRMMDAIAEDNIDIPDDVALSPDVLHLLVGLLEKDPSRRMTIEDVIVHPWVTGRDDDAASQLRQESVFDANSVIEDENMHSGSFNMRETLAPVDETLGDGAAGEATPAQDRSSSDAASAAAPVTPQSPPAPVVCATPRAIRSDRGLVVHVSETEDATPAAKSRSAKALLRKWSMDGAGGERAVLAAAMGSPSQSLHSPRMTSGAERDPMESVKSLRKTLTARRESQTRKSFGRKPTLDFMDTIEYILDNIGEDLVPRRKFAPGDCLIEEGEQARLMYFIVSGTAEVLKCFEAPSSAAPTQGGVGAKSTPGQPTATVSNYMEPMGDSDPGAGAEATSVLMPTQSAGPSAGLADVLTGRDDDSDEDHVSEEDRAPIKPVASRLGELSANNASAKKRALMGRYVSGKLDRHALYDDDTPFSRGLAGLANMDFDSDMQDSEIEKVEVSDADAAKIKEAIASSDGHSLPPALSFGGAHGDKAYERMVSRAVRNASQLGGLLQASDSRRSAAGQALRTLAHRGPGDVIGEMGLMGEQTRTASVVAIDEVLALQVDISALGVICDAVPRLQHDLKTLMAERTATRRMMEAFEQLAGLEAHVSELPQSRSVSRSNSMNRGHLTASASFKRSASLRTNSIARSGHSALGVSQGSGMSRWRNTVDGAVSAGPDTPGTSVAREGATHNGGQGGGVSNTGVGDLHRIEEHHL
ncbi:unnamed protein product [Pedinophyceae sp. YPF-701]|nr:unnamed protein product [Pedinophyceae sp. YPF-701]